MRHVALVVLRGTEFVVGPIEPAMSVSQSTRLTSRRWCSWEGGSCPSKLVGHVWKQADSKSSTSPLSTTFDVFTLPLPYIQGN